MTRPATLDHLTKRKPVERVVTLCLDEDAIEALCAAEASGTETAIKAARAAVEEETVSIRFRAVGRKAWEQLIEAHPPTDEDVAKAKEAGTEEPAFDLDSFAVAAVAACSVEPKLTEAQSRRLYDEWNATDFSMLYQACLDANMQSRVEHAGKA